jgi:hypothetical protein
VSTPSSSSIPHPRDQPPISTSSELRSNTCTRIVSNISYDSQDDQAHLRIVSDLGMASVCPRETNSMDESVGMERDYHDSPTLGSHHHYIYENSPNQQGLSTFDGLPGRNTGGWYRESEIPNSLDHLLEVGASEEMGRRPITRYSYPRLANDQYEQGHNDSTTLSRAPLATINEIDNLHGYYGPSSIHEGQTARNAMSEV